MQLLIDTLDAIVCRPSSCKQTWEFWGFRK